MAFLLPLAQALVPPAEPVPELDRLQQWVGIQIYLLILLAGTVIGIALWRRGRRDRPPLERRLAQMLRRTVGGEDLLVLLFVLFTLLTLSSAAFSFYPEPESIRPTTTVVVQSVVFHWAILVTVAILLRWRGMSWRRAFGIHRRRWLRNARAGLVAYLVMMPVVVLLMLLYHTVLRSLGVDAGMQDVARIINEEASLPGRIYLMFLGVILAPIAEELLFRGVCFPVLARRFGVLASMIVVSVTFALVHFHLPSILPLFVVSFALCLAYLHTNSLVVPIVMHMAFNGVHLILLELLR
jgi:membrane protease YdiL (CAAX protease family)